MKMRMLFHHGREAGWSDDLGIISPFNTWLESVDPGWYIYLDDEDVEECKQWCLENIRGSWYVRDGVFHISDKHDAALFKMRWS